MSGFGGKAGLWGLLAALWGISGCGVAHDAAVGVASVQLPAGKLYSADFYRTATPEAVREAIDGRSLAGESRTERNFGRNQGGSTFVGSGIAAAYSLFIPTSHVSERETTPLAVALDNSENPGVIKVLLEAGADVDGDLFGRHITRNGPKQEILDLLMAHAAPPERCEGVMALAGTGDTARLDHCFAAVPGTTPDCTNRAGYTPLMAVSDPDIIAYLLRRGADVNKAREDGLTALSLALGLGREKTAELLLEHGADVPRDGLTLAVFRGGIDDGALLKRLAARTAITGEVDEDQAVQAACYTGDVAVLSALLSRGASLRRDRVYLVEKDAADGGSGMIEFLSARGIQAEPGYQADPR